MATLTQAPLTAAQTGAPPVRLQTTLYDLIAARHVLSRRPFSLRVTRLAQFETGGTPG